jgi:hypothetical protein
MYNTALEMSADDHLSEFLEALRKMGLLKEVIKQGLARVDERAFCSSLKLGMSVSDTFRLPVDYGRSFEETILDGRYEWRNEELVSNNYPSGGQGIVEFEARYVHFAFDVPPEIATDAIEQADKSWSHASVRHVLALGATYPCEQCKYPIIGLGSVAFIGNKAFVPFLQSKGGRRGIDLYWRNFNLRPGCRVLLVRMAPLTMRP